MSEHDNDIIEPAEPVAEPVVAALPLPGAQLRAAREAHGLSLGEVSQALKFGVRQIEALENDDFSTLTGTTFIRGFVRSYARYLRLDEAPLLASLEDQAPAAIPEVRGVESMDAEMPVAGADPSKRLYWLAVGVLLLGAFAWFAWQGQPLVAPISGTSDTPEVAAPVEAPKNDVTIPLQPVPVTLPIESPAAVPVESKPGSEVVSPAASAAETATAAVASPNDRVLAFSFADVSWVEVRDATQRVVLTGKSEPGTRQTVRGRPPFQLVIGNAQTVKLRYEDRAVDLLPYIRADVARLTLDDNTKQ